MFGTKGKQSKDFNPIIMKNNSLILNLATDADEGYYMCQATNDIGSGLKKVIRVNVNGKFCIFIIYSLENNYIMPRLCPF